MGKLVETFAFAGSRLADGTPNASGKVWVYIQGTTTYAPVFADFGSDTALPQPIVLDAAGRAIFYIDQVVTIHVETAAGVTVNDYNLADSPGVVQIENSFFTGTLPDGSQGPGGVTDLQKVLTSAGVSFGGPDFTYVPAPGVPPRAVNAWMAEVHLSVKDFGAIGDGLHDDGPAFQATANRCIALGGGIVYIPPGVYNISAPILINSTASVSFQGAGYASQLKNTNAVAGLISITGSVGFQLSQFNIFSSPASTGAAVTLARCQAAVLSDMNISGHLTGFDLSTGSSPNLAVQVVRCFLFSNNSAGGRAIKLAGATYESSITDCVLVGPTAEVALELIGNVSASSFTTCTALRGNYITYGMALTSVVTGSTGMVSIHGNAFSTDGVANKRISITGTAPRFSNVGNNVEGYAYTASTSQTIVPDITNGRVVRVNATGAAAINISFDPPIPLGMSVRGMQLHFSLINTGPGNSNWFFNGAAGGFHLKPGAPGAITATAGVRTEIVVEFDPESNYWAEICRTEINI